MNEVISIRMDDLNPGDAVYAVLAMKGIYASMIGKIMEEVEDSLNSLVDSINACKDIDEMHYLPYGDPSCEDGNHIGLYTVKVDEDVNRYNLSIEVPADVFRFYCGYASACRNKIIRKEEERKKARQVKRTKRDKK